MTDAVAEYLGALQAEQGASPNTLIAYRRDLADFLDFLGRRPLAAVDADDVVGYIERLRRRGLRPASVCRRLSAVRGLYRHLLREGALAGDPTEHVDTPRGARPLPRTLPPANGSLRIHERPGSCSSRRTVSTAAGIAPRWTGMCSAWAIIRPCSSKSAVEQSRRSLMFAENAERTRTAPISSATARSALPMTWSSIFTIS